MATIQPVVLAGGTGTRLWPLSREIYPKQLLSLTDQASLLQNTISRLGTIGGSLPPIIVVGEDHRFITKSQIDELELGQEYTILLEPVGRNTAPAIAGAVEYVSRVRSDTDLTLLILPADHLISDVPAFNEAGNVTRLLEKIAELVKDMQSLDRQAVSNNHKPGTMTAWHPDTGR